MEIDNPGLLNPMDEEERTDLQNKLNEQRLKLEENKKYLEQLKNENENGTLTAAKLQRHGGGDDYLDPDTMLKNFLESLEKEEKNIDMLKEQLNDNSDVMSYIDNNHHNLISNNITNDKFFSSPNSLEEYPEQNFLFSKKASAKNFKFKINTVVAEEKSINIHKKNIIHFDKSIQVNVLTDAASPYYHLLRNGKRKGGKIFTLFPTSFSQGDEDLNVLKLSMTKSGKKDVILKEKKKTKWEDDTYEARDTQMGESGHDQVLVEIGVSAGKQKVKPLKVQRSKGERSKERSEEQSKEPSKVEGALSEEAQNKQDADKTKRISNSKGFLNFLDRSSKIIERTLGEQDMFNATFDFAAKDLSPDGESAEKLKLVNTYYCKKYTNGRPITDVKTSNIYSELFLASYGLSLTSNYLDPDGYVLVWNSTMNGRPEYVFTSESAVCTSIFNKFNPHLIIGGTYTGNVVLWDIRASQKPVQKTYLTAQGHLHPIFCAEVIGTQNAHNLVTADTDGRLCNWSLSMLTYPSDTIDLKKMNKEVSCCCFSFQEGELNTLYGGSDDGSLFQAQIHGAKVGITQFYNIHHGPLTAAEFHPLIEGTADDNNDLILTCSVDWSCKLLSIKEPNNPLFIFDSFDDYLMDVKWNPVHPAIFATCSSSGNIKVWNISYDLECSYFDMTVQAKCTNKIAWSCDGKKLIAADSDGTLTLWNSSSEIYQPKSEDIAKYDARIQKLRSEILSQVQTDADTF
ncbi:cytoplasmic dynein intermediate chain [Plasmodium gonderi]|uniref:Cytoplasmic dynein intermediate chain n=1 Tax=Plasmodium gonderi TaxID=77519 RepID=A0A1Y1JEZ4_PLAGO|nr:cytoplasmic dynein intermediate chain [Plasmodium gonderi]GAW79905.1 cytoplasmic dynein intermediate chain [Plasmodium gonderi]